MNRYKTIMMINRRRIKLNKSNSHSGFFPPVFDGLYKKNTVLASGLVIAPVILGATSVSKAAAIAVSFSLITFMTIIISSFFPRSIVYTIRIILYTLIASLVYVPVIIAEMQLFPDEVKSLGIIMPLLITNSLIVSKSELRFFRRTKGKMVIDVLSYIIGFDIVIIIVGFLREILGTGSLGGHLLGIPMTFSILKYPCGAFILVGILAALLRKIQFVIESGKEQSDE